MIIGLVLLVIGLEDYRLMGLVMTDYGISYDGLEPLLSLSENELLKSQDSAPISASIVLSKD